MEKPDVLVIGAGIIGCSLARELARAGLKVTVVDRGGVGWGASSAAAGLLVPPLDPSGQEPLARLGRCAAALYEGWLDELRQDGAADVGFRRPGLLEVCTDPRRAEQLQRGLAEAGGAGLRAEWLAAEELHGREPGLARGALGAAFFPEVAQVDPARLVRQVARVAERAGVCLREGEAVQLLTREGERITAVETPTGRYQPGVVVLAAGAWSGGIARGLGLELPTRPVKGQLLLADCRAPPVSTPLFAGEALLVPRPEGQLVVGVTVEEAGFDERVTLGGLRQILQGACALAPAVAQLPLGRAWAGLRPATPDGLPYLGPVPPLRNLWVSTGHFRKGVLLAPLCARLLARSILADRLDDELLPFTPARHLGG
jgi:glycine oxidase